VNQFQGRSYGNGTKSLEKQLSTALKVHTNTFQLNHRALSLFTLVYFQGQNRTWIIKNTDDKQVLMRFLQSSTRSKS